MRNLWRHVKSFVSNPIRYIVVTRRIRRTDYSRRKINERQDVATYGIGYNPRLKFENFATQMGPERSFDALLKKLRAIPTSLGNAGKESA